MALLDTQNLSVSYGGVRANNGIDLQCEAGALVGLIGPNGAGKTTFIDAVTGFAPLSSGSVTFDGIDVTTHRPSRRARQGMARTFQSLELFEDLTVRDNLLAAAERPKWYSIAADLVAPRRGSGGPDVVRDVLDMVGLPDAVDRLPVELSHGQRRLVSVARAFVARPQLVLLDEPAAGLDSGESAALGDLLRTIVAEGTALLLVDHDMGLVLEVSDTICVLDFGSVIASGEPNEIRSDPVVIEAYLGTSDTAETAVEQ